jgi:DNA modification methylase
METFVACRLAGQEHACLTAARTRLPPGTMQEAAVGSRRSRQARGSQPREPAPGRLYYGDNLVVLREHIRDESVDLAYLDPPFNSDQDYNVLFADQNGSRSQAQVRAFEDTWRWDEGAARAYQDMVSTGPDAVARTMEAFRTFMGTNDMLAYLAMMAPRLVELRRVLRRTGTIYLHCDPTASHYLKLLMDAVFGARNFLNEIIWYYRGAGVPRRARARRHDVILCYAKVQGEHQFYPDPIRRPYAEATVDRFNHYIGNVRGGRDFGKQRLHPLGKHPDDVITDIQPIAPSAKARLGYPTQKPEELLEDFIEASSREGDTILDPFCGCGTTVAVAQRLKRSWIGIDITHLAIALIKHRLRDAFGEKLRYEVTGEPEDLAGARQLAKSDPYQFQWWALSLVGARPVEKRKGADKGIDGRLRFSEGAEPDAETKQMVVSVKSGRPAVSHVRELRGVVEREKAVIGVLIAMEEPTRAMREESAGAGFYDSRWTGRKHPRLQILTVADLLSGKGIDCPPLGQTNVTFRRAPKAGGAGEENEELDLKE